MWKQAKYWQATKPGKNLHLKLIRKRAGNITILLDLCNRNPSGHETLIPTTILK